MGLQATIEECQADVKAEEILAEVSQAPCTSEGKNHNLRNEVDAARRYFSQENICALIYGTCETTL